MYFNVNTSENTVILNISKYTKRFSKYQVMHGNQFQNKETKETTENLCGRQVFEQQKLVVNATSLEFLFSESFNNKNDCHFCRSWQENYSWWVVLHLTSN